MTAWTGLQNTAAWMLIVVAVSAAVGGFWCFIVWIIGNFCHAPSALKLEKFSSGVAEPSPAGSDAEKSGQPLSQQPPVSRSVVPPPFALPARKGLSAETMGRTRLANRRMP